VRVTVGGDVGRPSLGGEESSGGVVGLGRSCMGTEWVVGGCGGGGGVMGEGVGEIVLQEGQGEWVCGSGKD